MKFCGSSSLEIDYSWKMPSLKGWQLGVGENAKISLEVILCRVSACLITKETPTATVNIVFFYIHTSETDNFAHSEYIE